jgi:hypothetical protein
MKPLLLSLLCISLGLFPCTALSAAPVWSFVVMGDTRDATTDTLTGISPDLPRLAAAVAAEKPDLVIHTGDLANGYFTTGNSPMHGRYREMFRNWKAAMKPLHDYATDRGVPVYLVRGNHEDGKYTTERDLKKAYDDEFALLMPQNGPAAEKGLTYGVRHKGARFIALDAYHETRFKVIRGYVNQQWLDGYLARDRTPFTFAFSHTPAYRVGDYHESPFPDLYSHAGRRDDVWKSLKRGGTVAYFCGHIHFYCRGTVNGIEQVVVGNGGADTVSFDGKKADPAIAMHYPTSAMAATDIKTGYLVMTVDEQAGTVHGIQKLWNRKTGKWEQGDDFTLKAR